MKNLEDYSAEPVCPSSYLTRLHMELGEEKIWRSLFMETSLISLRVE